MTGQPSPYGDHRPTELEAERAAHAATRQRPEQLAPHGADLGLAWLRQPPRAEVTALVVAPSVAICDICTMAAFLSLDEGQRRHALRCLHGQGHGVTVVTPQATDEAVAALLANPDTLRDLHRRTQAAEAEVHALRRQLEHAGRQWNEAVADRNRYQGWARQGKSLNRDLTAAIRAHLDARDRCDPSAEHATRQALDALLTETPRPDGAE